MDSYLIGTTDDGTEVDVSFHNDQSTKNGDVIAFPKVKDASCLLTDAPNIVDENQLTDLGIAIIPQENDSEE